MYNRTYWKDHIVDADTKEVLQEGTLMDAEHFNNMEEGILAAAEMLKSLEVSKIQATLTNTQSYPFNDSQQTISLTTEKATTDYRVYPEVVSYEGGGVGDIEITEKLLNGFKVAYTGAAKSVVLNLHVSGGE